MSWVGKSRFGVAVRLLILLGPPLCWGFAQLPTKMSTRRYFWGRALPTRKAANLSVIYEPTVECGILNFLQPCRPPLPATGIALLAFLQSYYKLLDLCIIQPVKSSRRLTLNWVSSRFVWRRYWTVRSWKQWNIGSTQIHVHFYVFLTDGSCCIVIYYIHVSKLTNVRRRKVMYNVALFRRRANMCGVVTYRLVIYLDTLLSYCGS
jgi:hypothetical protein